MCDVMMRSEKGGTLPCTLLEESSGGGRKVDRRKGPCVDVREEGGAPAVGDCALSCVEEKGTLATAAWSTWTRTCAS